MNSCVSSRALAGGVPPPIGFTLVELLIATAISSILLMTLTSSINSAINVWTRHDRGIGMVREMRAAVNFLEADLAGFVALPDDPNTTADDLWLRFQSTSPKDGMDSSRLLFLTVSRQPTKDKGKPDLGPVQLVAYAVGLTPDANGRPSQKLFRKQFSPEDTQTRVSSLMREKTPLLSEKDWQSVMSGTDGSEPVAYDLVRFAVQPLKAIKNLATEPSVVNGLGADTTPWQEEMRPAAVDLTLRIVSHRTASRLETAADWRGEGAFSRQLLGSPPTPLDYSDDQEVSTHQIRVLLP